MFDIWRYPSKLVEEQYSKENIKIVTSFENIEKNNVCTIFCSSNSIWSPNEKEYFESSIINLDRYEWTNFDSCNSNKKIFIRDIYKSWYVTGVNNRINTIDKLVEYLKAETKGYNIVLVGSSSGGYLAALLSCLLEADYAIVFSAQFELRNKGALDVNPFLQKYNDFEDYSKYYDLKPWLEKRISPIYYIVPICCAEDRYHWDYIHELDCIRSITFKSKHHGIVIPKNNLNKLLSLDLDDLEKMFKLYKGKMVSPILFSFNFVGVVSTIKEINRIIFKILKKNVKVNTKNV